MNRKRSIGLAVLLAAVLAGNTFAGDLTGGGVSNYLTDLCNVVITLLTGSPCEGRQCQTCKPTESGGEGNCRPTQ